MSNENPKRQRTIQAINCFVDLMVARERRQAAVMYEALASLARLGVLVRLQPKRRGAKKGNHAAR